MKRHHRLTALAGLALLGLLFFLQPEEKAPARDGAIEAAFAARQSDVWVTGSGRVTRLLADDNEGSRHQRFIVQLASGQTVLVSHNIDLAPRLDALAAGHQVTFHGEYEWNDRGGVVHWTHHDPRGRRAGGWIEHQGQRYR